MLGVLACDRGSGSHPPNTLSCTACRVYHKSCEPVQESPHFSIRIRHLVTTAIAKMEALIQDIEKTTGCREDAGRVTLLHLCQFRDINGIGPAGKFQERILALILRSSYWRYRYRWIDQRPQ